MNNDFKATHVIVATSYDRAEEFELTVGTEVILAQDAFGKYCANKKDYRCDTNNCIVEPIKSPAKLFTEEQLRELEGLYGLVRVVPSEAVTEAVSLPRDVVYGDAVIISDGVAKEGDKVWYKGPLGPVQFVLSKQGWGWFTIPLNKGLFSFSPPKGKFIYE